jgi:SAM-dependent methyltransferase
MELGCGVGRLAPWFVAKGGLYTGLDISAEMLNIARRRHPELTFCKVDSPELPFRDASFDVVCSVTVLHHNAYEWQNRMIDELVRVTRSGGLITIMESIRAGPRSGSMPMTPTTFDVFPRYLEDWVDEVERHGRAKLTRSRMARWALTRDVVDGLLTKTRRAFLGPAAQRCDLPAGFARALMRIGLHIDPYIMGLLPRKYARNGGLCFQKT